MLNQNPVFVLNVNDVVIADFKSIGIDDGQEQVKGIIKAIVNPNRYKTPVITIVTDGGKEKSFNSSFVVKILEKGKSTKKYRPSSILATEDGKWCLTDKKNVWCGPPAHVAQAVMQINYPDYLIDFVKFNNLWSKNKLPGLIRREEHFVYLNGKKFRRFVERNIFRIKKTVKDIRASWQKYDRKIQEDYWNSLDEEAKFSDT